MNKSALKNFATKARKELLERVELEARKIGITKEKIEEATVESSDAVFINDRQLSDIERKQRNKLIIRIDEIGFDRVMDEAAYTWFNRFIALRFMEVNDYLPTRVRVLSSENEGSTEPDMMTEALSLDLEIDRDLVYNLKLKNETDELFKYLIKLHCNDLNRYMPFMFETIEDYYAILFPEGLLGTDSFVREMTDTEVIPEDNWENVEIIGWLYQYYIADENDRVIRAKNRYKKEEIPFATQLFTPEWIVRYMVQNSLGRYWIESHPEHRDLIDNWEYFLENPNPEVDFEEKLAPYINKELKVEDIKCFDPAMGSGHILVYMFDVLFEIYSKAGYMEREIPRLIIENNLYGLDIDDRAYQLASFSIVMKALEYNRRFLRSIEREGLKINLASIQETNLLTDQDIKFLSGESSGENYDNMKSFIEQFKHAKAIGSLIKVDSYDASFFKERSETIKKESENLFEIEAADRVLPLFESLLKQAAIMKDRYDVLVTNPPYVGRRYLTKEITDYIDQHYPDVKSDLFSSFMEYSFTATKENGQIGFMTPYVWMFIRSYEKLRTQIINDRNISSLVQLEYSGFDGATVPICTFTLRNYNSDTKGEYVRLSDFRGAANQSIKTLEAVQDPAVDYRYSFDQVNFSKIPGSTIVYWSSPNIHKVFSESENLYDFSTSASQNVTGNNRRFLRYHFEVDKGTVGVKEKWIFYAKGGGYRKWYGNMLEVINWTPEARHIYRTGHASQIIPKDFWYKKGITWGLITSSLPSFRLLPEGSTFDKGGSSIFINNDEYYLYILGFLNTKVALYLLRCLNTTLNFQVRDIRNLPIIIREIFTVKNLVRNLKNLTRNDWDSFETSWDFEEHPLLKFPSNTIEYSFYQWEDFSKSQFNQLRENEEELNRIFIDIYGLQDELNPDIKDKDVTVSKADLERDIKSFVSYAVGCMLGRYSLDEEGLVYAGGEFDSDRYKTFPADENNILPILPGAYFEDDIVNKFIKFVEVTYGADTLEENLTFIAGALGQRRNETSRETIRRYFITQSQFYTDHVRTYKRTPIYWMFTSGRERAFNCLIYMHRYDKTTLSRIRTEYLHEVQTRYESEKQDLQMIIDGDSTAKEIRDAKRELTSVERKLDELKEYDEKLRHLADMQIAIDLDDGVRENYKKFKGLVARI